MTEPIKDWRSLGADDLVAQFSPRIAVPDAQDWLNKWAGRSIALARSWPGKRDIRYGDGPKMTFDLHLAGEPGAPVVVFIHGGFWRMLDKADHVFAAHGLHRSGFTVVNLNYDLCPTVSLTALNAQIARALAYISENAADLGITGAPVTLMGHSAGAHAAAFAAANPDLPNNVAAIVPVSGILDTNAVVHLPFNEDVCLTENEASALNVMEMPPRSGLRALVTVGGDEPPAWIGQSVVWHEMASDHIAKCELEIIPGTHHFSVLEACCNPDHAAGQRVAAFIAKTAR
ncbi:MAG: alpha/beta hydrolase [Alphaproteobacteria bacterium]